MPFCPSCGAQVAEEVRYCSECGKPMPVPTIPSQPPPPGPAYAPPPYGQPGYPPQPGYPQAPYGVPYPQYPPQPQLQPYGYPAFRPPPEKTGVPIAAGVMLIVAGILGIVNWVVVFLLGTLASFIPFLGAVILVCGLIGVTFSVFALLGGVMAIQRKMWGLALTGSILGLFIVGFVGEASLLSLIALILLAISHREFT